MKSGRQGQEGRVSGPNTRQCDTVLASVKDASRRQEAVAKGPSLTAAPRGVPVEGGRDEGMARFNRTMEYGEESKGGRK